MKKEPLNIGFAVMPLTEEGKYMGYFRRKNYTPVAPVKTQRNQKTRTWFLIDVNNVIFVEGLSKEVAITIQSAMNYIEKVFDLLEDLYSHEDVVHYRKDHAIDKANFRDILVKRQFLLLKDFGIDVKWIGAQDYRKNLWIYFHDLIENQRQQTQHARRKQLEDFTGREHSNSE